jgi:ribosomal protein S18 acetylase RimI-like enzyme
VSAVDRLHVTVRDLAPGDRAGWDAVWTAYLASYRTTLPAEVTELLWRRLTGTPEQRHPQMGGLGAFDAASGRLVGLAHYVSGPSTWEVRDDGYLEDLAVAPDVQGRGVGRALVEAVILRARERDWRRVHWITEESNTRARLLYDRIGTRTAYVRYHVEL